MPLEMPLEMGSNRNDAPMIYFKYDWVSVSFPSIIEMRLQLIVYSNYIAVFHFTVFFFTGPSSNQRRLEEELV